MKACPHHFHDMLITSDFEKSVLLDPARLCSSLKIISGFTDCERISTHMIALQDGVRKKHYQKSLSVDLIVGMTKSITKKKHDDICRLLDFLKTTRDMPSIRCRYVWQGREVHSKIYVWSDASGPCVAWCGSVNYTMNAFFKRRECLAMCDPVAAMAYFDALEPDTLDCHSANIEDQKIDAGKPQDIEDQAGEEYDIYDKQVPVDTLRVSLLQADGSKTGYGSGINWGIRPNGTRRDQNQAYIPYNQADRKPGFFSR